MTPNHQTTGQIRLALLIRPYQDLEIVVKDQLVRIRLVHQWAPAKWMDQSEADNMDQVELLHRDHFSFFPKRIQINFQTVLEPVHTGYHPNPTHQPELDFITRIIRREYNVIIT